MNADIFFLCDNPEGDLCEADKIVALEEALRGNIQATLASFEFLYSANQLWTRTVRNSVWDTQEHWGPILIILCKTILQLFFLVCWLWIVTDSLDHHLDWRSKKFGATHTAIQEWLGAKIGVKN